MSMPFKREQDKSVRLLFGKFKGECLQDIPDSYLRWIEENAKAKTDNDLLDEVVEELAFRKKTNTWIGD